MLSSNFGTSLAFLIHLACNLWAMYCRRAGGVWSCLQCFSLGFCLSVSLLLRHRELSLLREMTQCDVFTCFACVRVSHKPRFLISSFVPVDDGDISHTCLWLSCWLWNISSEEKGERILFIYLFIYSLLTWKMMSRFTVSVRWMNRWKRDSEKNIFFYSKVYPFEIFCLSSHSLKG